MTTRAAPFPEPRERAPQPASEYPATPYPGARPRCSWVYDRGGVVPLEHAGGRWRLAATGEDLDEWLDDRGAAPMAERVAVVSHGSNACPAAIAESALDGTGPLVTLRARLGGLAAAWCAHPTGRGVLPSTLVEAEGDEAGFVTLFDRADQIDAVNAKEHRGRGPYDLVRLDEGTVLLEDGRALVEPLTFVAGRDRGVLVGPDGAPVLLRDTPYDEAVALRDRPDTGETTTEQVLRCSAVAPGEEPTPATRPA